MWHVHAICLDLDDTLWEIQPVIARAERLLDNWIRERHPRVASEIGADELRKIRLEVADTHPDRRHDLGFLRRESLRRVAHLAQDPDGFVAEAFDRFLAARNEVTLYDDVIPALTRLSASYRLFALSNGNADLAVIGLGRFFERTFSARELGVAKPDPRVFRLFAAQAGVTVQNVMHVGDDPQNDITAAAAVGMTTVWVNRRADAWTGDLPEPDHEIVDLTALAELLGS